jgi:hypothetical protein
MGIVCIVLLEKDVSEVVSVSVLRLNQNAPIPSH